MAFINKAGNNLRVEFTLAYCIFKIFNKFYTNNFKTYLALYPTNFELHDNMASVRA